MFEAVDENFDRQDIVIMSAAVADYRPKTVATEKIKKKDGEDSIQLERTTDILGTMSKERRPVCMWFLNGNREYVGELKKPSLKRRIWI